MFAFLFAAASIIGAFDADMSVQEMKQTGMAKLSAQEKMALQNWIETRYSKREVIAQNLSGKKNLPPTLSENLKNGHYIRLSDNSLWEINPSDTPITQGWITPVEIKISASDDSSYPYNLTNSLTGSTVKARKAESSNAPATSKSK